MQTETGSGLRNGKHVGVGRCIGHDVRIPGRKERGKGLTYYII